MDCIDLTSDRELKSIDSESSDILNEPDCETDSIDLNEKELEEKTALVTSTEESMNSMPSQAPPINAVPLKHQTSAPLQNPSNHNKPNIASNGPIPNQNHAYQPNHTINPTLNSHFPNQINSQLAAQQQAFYQQQMLAQVIRFFM